MRFEGSNCIVENNSVIGIDIYGGTGSAGTGSGTLVRNNTGGGFVKIDQASNTIVVGNTFQRVRVLGYIASGHPASNNRIGGPTLSERNYIIGQGTLNSQGIPGGFAVQLFNAIGTVIENNWIGTTPDGLSKGHLYTTSGIYFDTENYDTVIRNNRIAGIDAIAVPPHGPAYHTGTAIQLWGSGSGVTIVGNKIGLNANDEPVLGSVTGIASVHYSYPNGMSNVVIGGPGPGEGNEIAGHLGVGVSIANTYQGVRISSNSIHDNGGLGIDLVSTTFDYGLTPNDLLDADAGGNGLQNFPEVTSAVGDGTSTTIQGTLHSLPNQAFTLEFFASPTCDPSGHGEGSVYLGATSESTDGAGDASFSATVPAGAPPGSFITTTATRAATGSTSEFSACVSLVGGGATCDTIDFNHDSLFPDTQDIDDFLSVFSGGPCSTGACGDIDFNNDGLFPDTMDIDALLSVFSGGPCLL